jgi:hypothetical protein
MNSGSHWQVALTTKPWKMVMAGMPMKRNASKSAHSSLVTSPEAMASLSRPTVHPKEVVSISISTGAKN